MGFTKLNDEFHKSYIGRMSEIIILTSIAPFVFIVFRKLFRQKGYLFRQGLIIVLSGTIPIILYAYRILLNGDLLPSLIFDPVPVVSSVSILFLGIAAIRYRLLNLVPIAFKEFVENIRTPFMILDNTYRILYCNEAFRKEFLLEGTNKESQTVNFFLEQLSQQVESTYEVEALGSIIHSENAVTDYLELSISNPVKKYYKVSVQPVVAFSNEKIGKLISFSDITDYKNLAMVEAELAATKAHWEISRDAHDTIGYAMTHIIMYLREDLSNLSEEELKSRQNAMRALKMALSKNEEFRELLYKKTRKNPANTQPADYRNHLFSKLQKMENELPAGIKLSKTLDARLTINNEKYFNTIYKICEEGINNSLKHSDCKNIDIILKQSDGFLRLNIIDDGKGCKTVKEGIGLSGMSDRVKSLGGTLAFSNEDDGGFRIIAKIPILSEKREVEKLDAESV